METWISMRDMRSVNVIRGDSRVTKHGKTVAPAVIHYSVDGQISFAYLRDIFRLTYEHKPLGELRARITASWFRFWYLIEKKSRRLAKLRRIGALMAASSALAKDAKTEAREFFAALAGRACIS
jgi:hypothetical protein